MRTAHHSDRPRLLDLLARSFRSVPGILQITGNGPGFERRLRVLLEYALDYCERFGEVLISDDGHAVALLKYPNQERFSWHRLWLQARLAWRVIGVRRLPEMLRREAVVKRQHPANRPFIHVWFLAADPRQVGFSSIRELKNSLFRKAFEARLPIYCETTLPQNAAVYSRYGFEIFHENPGRPAMWFFRREPSLAHVTSPEMFPAGREMQFA